MERMDVLMQVPGGRILRVQAAACSKIGSLHVAEKQPNQDRFGIYHGPLKRRWFIDHEYASLGVFLVADGMGGRPGGEVAAEKVIESILNRAKLLGRHPPRSWAATEDWFLQIALPAARSALILSSGDWNSDLQRMGTTVAGIMLSQYGLVAHIGDTRVSELKSGGRGLSRLTTDHNLVEDNSIDPRVKCQYRQRGIPLYTVATRSIRVDGFGPPDFRRLDSILPGDRYLIGTDGLNELSAKELEEILLSFDDPCMIAETIVKESQAAAGHDHSDDATALVIVMSEPPQREAWYDIRRFFRHRAT